MRYDAPDVKPWYETREASEMDDMPAVQPLVDMASVSGETTDATSRRDELEAADSDEKRGRWADIGIVDEPCDAPPSGRRRRATTGRRRRAGR